MKTKTETKRPTPTAHLWLDKEGVAWIDDTNTKVIEIVLDQIGYGWSAEEIHRQYPYLTLAQIHAALSYYYDHKEAFDEQIKRDLAEAERLWEESNQTSPFRKRMRAQGILP